ncbi:UbiA family prenyltransferase [Pelagibaculum spongiae]|uniref:Prenyltransferase n=1 Tax=Pelagibaculum spongiae TaxID=2080658 RepID=A0A2V1H5H7_9GAMM|nr:UbiA family prenyltransferase [Pelagibaculum spongiae]PVZ72457.1 prenyltransferase [Pelagibaculum spongiae]
MTMKTTPKPSMSIPSVSIACDDQQQKTEPGSSTLAGDKPSTNNGSKPIVPPSNTINNLSMNASIFSRLMAWSKERFPFVNMLLTASLYLLAAPLARQASHGDPSLQWFDILGLFSAIALFLLLRILDEHKDYALDIVNHPQRVLQRGLITLRHLKILGAICILVMLAGNLFVDWQTMQIATSTSSSIGIFPIAVSLSWLAMMLWLVLMTVEFFCPQWLNRHLVIYALSHMLIMPLIAVWMATMATGTLQFTTPVLLLACLFFFSGLCFEITRKTRGPEEDRPEVESYSLIFGAKGSALIVIALLTCMSSLQLATLYQVTPNAFVYIAPAMVCCFLLGLKQLIKFIKAPSLAGRESNEKAVGLAMLIGYWSLTGGLLIAG